jgi:hypothetical protein
MFKYYLEELQALKLLLIRLKKHATSDVLS